MSRRVNPGIDGLIRRNGPLGEFALSNSLRIRRLRLMGGSHAMAMTRVLSPSAIPITAAVEATLKIRPGEGAALSGKRGS